LKRAWELPKIQNGGSVPVKTHKVTAIALLMLLFALLFGNGQLATAETAVTLDPCDLHPYPIGDLNGDCRYNLVDVVLLINAVFIFPIDPFPVNGDVNCDNVLDIFDIIQLSDFIFAKGPALQPCDGR
jgi:hypothetical protein